LRNSRKVEEADWPATWPYSD